MTVRTTQQRLDWLLALARDPHVSHLARVGVELSSYVNQRTGEAFPGQERMAANLRIDVRSVRNAVDQFEEHGYLEVTRGTPNRYRLIMPNRKPVSGFSDAQTGNVVQPNRKSTASKPEIHCTQTGSPLPPNSKYRTLSINSKKNSKRESTRPTPLPADWPTPSDRAWVADHLRKIGRLDLVDTVDAEARKARNKYAERGKLSADWSATWRYWIENTLTFRKDPAPTPEAVKALAVQILGRDAETRIRQLGKIFLGNQVKIMAKLKEAAAAQGSADIFLANYLWDRPDPEGRLAGENIGALA